MFLSGRFLFLMLCSIMATLAVSNRAMAYVGPGSGMEFIGSALALIAMVGAAFLSILMWPIYAVRRWIRGIKHPSTVERSLATNSIAVTPPLPTPVTLPESSPPAPLSPSGS
jgi:hypothetical protein